MNCSNCSAPLPDESLFCPYCMEKFGEGQKTEDSSAAGKKTVPLLIAVAAVTMAVIIAVVIFCKTKSRNQIQTPESSQTVTVEIDGKYYPPGTYYRDIDGDGYVVLRDFDNYPF